MNSAEYGTTEANAPLESNAGENDRHSAPSSQAAIPQSGELQRAILASTNLSIFATDVSGTIQFFNAGAERMLGYTAADVVNRLRATDLHDPQELAARAANLADGSGHGTGETFDALVGKASRGEEDIDELSYLRRDGSRIAAIVSIKALRDDHDQTIGYLFIGTNNFVRKRVEAALTRVQAAAEAASQVKSDFLLQLSHELRTPLNVILGFAELMESSFPPLAASQKSNLAQIQTAGRYLLELTNEILDRALIETGKVTLSQEPVSLAEVLAECQQMIEPQAKRRYISIRFPRFEVPCFIKSDRTRVKQVLMNLLLNAIKYNRPRGSVSVEYAAVSSKPNTMRISVRDTGKGLTPEQLAQLFQPFNRLGQEAGEEEGAGIGLVVSRQLIEMMGGTIGAESTVGTGSVFWIELAMASAPALAIPQPAGGPTAPTQSSADTSPRTVLYVEDNPANLELVRQLIARRADLQLLTATDGKLGIEMARKLRPDVILMDINMPGMTGIDAMRILRDDPSTAHIPVVALSANAMPRDIQRGLEAGFFNYLTKPIKFDEFMMALDAVLQFSKSASSRTSHGASTGQIPG